MYLIGRENYILTAVIAQKAKNIADQFSILALHTWKFIQTDLQIQQLSNTTEFTRSTFLDQKTYDRTTAWPRQCEARHEDMWGNTKPNNTFCRVPRHVIHPFSTWQGGFPPPFLNPLVRPNKRGTSHHQPPPLGHGHDTRWPNEGVSLSSSLTSRTPSIPPLRTAMGQGDYAKARTIEGAGRRVQGTPTFSLRLILLIFSHSPSFQTQWRWRRR